MAKKGKRPPKNKRRHEWGADCESTYCPNPEHWHWVKWCCNNDRGWQITCLWDHPTYYALSVTYPRKHRRAFANEAAIFQHIVEQATLAHDLIHFRALAVLAYHGERAEYHAYRDTVEALCPIIRKTHGLCNS